MSEEPEIKPTPVESEFSHQVGEKAARKLKAQRHVTQTVWSGLGMMGLVGWSVVVPTLLGAALGIWIDEHYPGSHSWTLALLTIGLLNARSFISPPSDRGLYENVSTKNDPGLEPCNRYRVSLPKDAIDAPCFAIHSHRLISPFPV